MTAKRSVARAARAGSAGVGCFFDDGFLGLAGDLARGFAGDLARGLAAARRGRASSSRAAARGLARPRRPWRASDAAFVASAAGFVVRTMPKGCPWRLRCCPLRRGSVRCCSAGAALGPCNCTELAQGARLKQALCEREGPPQGRLGRAISGLKSAVLSPMADVLARLSPVRGAVHNALTLCRAPGAIAGQHRTQGFHSEDPPVARARICEFGAATRRCPRLCS